MDKNGGGGGGATFFTYLENGEMEKLKRRKKEGRRGEDLQSITSRVKKTGFGISILHYPGGKRKKEVIMFIYSPLLRRGGREKKK